MKRCIVNYACRGREDYPKGQARLQKCLAEGLGENNGQLFFTHNLPPNCPPHEEVPYAFKYYAMKTAFDLGYEQVIWLDASVVILKSMEPLWQILEERGILVFDNPGCPENFFTSGDVLDHWGVSIEEAKEINQICGGVVGYTMEGYPKDGRHIFEQMMDWAQDGISFQGGSNTSPDPEFVAHRHDQSCLSWLVHSYMIVREPFEVLSYTSGMTDKTILELRGIT